MSNKCNWRLEAISKAAINRKKTIFVLKAGENTVGKRKDNHIKIPSALCSRDHCSIFLDGDNVTVKDISRNGTYITFAGDIGTKHYTNMTTEQPLGANDIISFGFNTASIYDVNDKNAYIYRLVKEVIETIDIDDSDDETESAPPPVRGKVIEIANKVIDIPSDSDSNYSGDECLRNIDEIEQQDGEENELVSDSSVESLDDSIHSEYSDSEESDIESDDENFVVTKTIVKCPTPTETISLDEDDENEDEEKKVAKDEIHDETANDNQKRPLSEKSNDKTANGAFEEPSSSVYHENDSKSNNVETTPNTIKILTNVLKVNENESDKSIATSTEQQTESSSNKDENYRLECLKRRLAENVPKKPTTIQARPLKKRRQTITEFEYNEKIQAKKLSAEQRKQMVRERLANLGNEQKAKRDAAAENSADSNRIPFVPKVKNAIASRGAQLCTDMLALNPTNI